MQAGISRSVPSIAFEIYKEEFLKKSSFGPNEKCSPDWGWKLCKLISPDLLKEFVVSITT